jgi:hypothetical protein
MLLLTLMLGKLRMRSIRLFSRALLDWKGRPPLSWANATNHVVERRDGVPDKFLMSVERST